MKKEKVLKIVFEVIFILSFLPVVVLLGNAIYSSFVGCVQMNLFTEDATIYGFEAFKYVMAWGTIGLCYTFVLPICVLYQLVFIVVSIVIWAKKRTKEENKKTLRIVLRCIFLVSFLPIIVLLYQIFTVDSFHMALYVSSIVLALYDALYIVISIMKRRKTHE